MDVGRGDFTPAKHAIMVDFIRHETGAVNSMTGSPYSIRRAVWIDLTAGHAGDVPDFLPWHLNCTPGIFASQALQMCVPVLIDLYEVKPGTYQALSENLAERLPRLGYERMREDMWKGRTRNGSPIYIRANLASGSAASVDYIKKGDAVVAINDPNAITKWAMRPTFAKEVGAITGFFRSISVMGCNANGVKRKGLEKRLGWHDHVERQLEELPDYRDLFLASVERDASQWAYLICTSRLPKWKMKVERSAVQAFRNLGRTLATAWLKDDPEKFEELKNILFYTKKELQEVGK